MTRQRNSLTSFQQRLVKLFNEVDDEDVRETMINVISIEARYRSASRQRFPMAQVRDVIDAVARRQESLNG